MKHVSALILFTTVEIPDRLIADYGVTTFSKELVVTLRKRLPDSWSAAPSFVEMPAKQDPRRCLCSYHQTVLTKYYIELMLNLYYNFTLFHK